MKRAPMEVYLDINRSVQLHDRQSRRKKSIESLGRLLLLLLDGFRFEIGEFFLGSGVLFIQFAHLLNESKTLL